MFHSIGSGWNDADGSGNGAVITGSDVSGAEAPGAQDHGDASPEPWQPCPSR